jgi:hypothetical protein
MSTVQLRYTQQELYSKFEPNNEHLILIINQPTIRTNSVDNPWSGLLNYVSNHR